MYEIRELGKQEFGGELGLLGQGGAAFDVDAAILIAAMTTPPDATRQALINTTILSLKSKGIWALLDECWFLAAATSQAALLGWKRYKNLSAVNSPTFTADRGYAGDGASSYLNTGYVPATNGVQYQQDSASLGSYSRTDSSGAANDIGVRHSSASRQARLQTRNGSTLLYAANQDTASSVTNASSLGLFAIRRSGASALAVFRNGSSIATDTAASSTPPAFAIYIGAVNTGGSQSLFSARQLAFAFVGASLTDQQMSDLYAIVQAYMTGVGANV